MDLSNLRKLLSILTLLSLCIASKSADAQLLGWSETQQITFSSGQVFTPSIAVSPTGAVHTVWSDNSTGTRKIHYLQLDSSGNTVVPATNITFDLNGSRRPIIAVDPDGFIHVVWEDSRDANEELYHLKLDAAGAIVIPAHRLTNDPGRSKNAKMVFGEDRNLRIVWQDYRNDNWLLIMRQFSASGNPIGPEMHLTSPPFDSVEPDIALDSDGDAHVVWSDNRPGFNQVVYAKVSPTLTVDGSPVTDGTNSSFSPRISISPDDTVHIVWRDFRHRNSEVYYQKQDKQGEVLANDLRITVDFPASLDTSIIADHTGAANLIWRDNSDGNLEIQFSRIDKHENLIMDSIRLTDDPADSVTPVMAIGPGDGRTHLIWLDYRDDPTFAEIFYKTFDLSISSREGTVNRGIGAAADVVTLNGSSGDPETRVIQLTTSDPGTVHVDPPPLKPQGARYLLYLYNTGGNSLDARNAGYGIGDQMLSNPLAGPGIMPDTILNGLNHYPLLGFPTQIPKRAPSIALRFRDGLPSPGTFVIQGYILDPGAMNGVLSVTNALVLEVTP